MIKVHSFNVRWGFLFGNGGKKDTTQLKTQIWIQQETKLKKQTNPHHDLK